MIYLFSFLFVLSLVVIIHEGGHFLVARLCGIQVEAFSIGFGKKLFSWKDKKGTEWRICAIPLGGYVQMFGDEDASSGTKTTKDLTEEEKKRTFFAQPLYKRALVVFAGPFMNYVLGIVILTILFMSVGMMKTPCKIGSVLENSAAEEAGLKTGDLILEINGKKVDDFGELKQKIVMTEKGQSLKIKFLRENEIKETSATPKMVGEMPLLGATPDLNVEVPAIKLNFFQSVKESCVKVYQMTEMTLVYLGQLITGKRGTSDLRGIVGIAEASGDFAKMGWLPFLLFIVNISVGIGFVNLLPIPVLDGGHLALFLYEAIFRRPLSEKAQNHLMKIGLTVLLLLMAFTFYNDIPRVFKRLFLK